MSRNTLWLILTLTLMAVGLGLLFDGGAVTAAAVAAPAPALPQTDQHPHLDGIGIAVFRPPFLRAGMTETFCLVYTATSTISTSGSIRIVDPDFNGMGWTMTLP